MHDGSDELDRSQWAVFVMKFSFMASCDIFFVAFCHQDSFLNLERMLLILKEGRNSSQSGDCKKSNVIISRMKLISNCRDKKLSLSCK